MRGGRQALASGGHAAARRRVQATFVRRTLKGQVSKYRSRVQEAEAAAASSRERVVAAEREAAGRAEEAEAAGTRACQLASHMRTTADAASRAADMLHRSGPHTPAVAEAITVLDSLRQGVVLAESQAHGGAPDGWEAASRRTWSATGPIQAQRAKRRRARSASASTQDGDEREQPSGQPASKLVHRRSSKCNRSFVGAAVDHERAGLRRGCWRRSVPCVGVRNAPMCSQATDITQMRQCSKLPVLSGT